MRAIAFNEGLESIATRAFYGSHLEKVELPASLKNCGSLCFSTVQRVIFNGDTLPKGFISAITLDEFDSNDGVEAVKVYLKDIDKTIYIPKQMSQIGIETAIFHLEGCSLAEADTYLFVALTALPMLLIQRSLQRWKNASQIITKKQKNF